jgi:ribosomal protein S18 acetylase RimI-like enzyme
MSSTSLFRRATEADLPALLEMMRDFYAHESLRFDPGVAERALREMLADDRLGRVFLIGGGAEAAGYAVLTFGYSLEFHGRDAFVDELYLQEGARGRGTGRQALEFLAGVCSDLGVRALHLEVERENETAQRLYRGFGFQDHDRYLMTKRVSSL